MKIIKLSENYKGYEIQNCLGTYVIRKNNESIWEVYHYEEAIKYIDDRIQNNTI